jgi:hypothetical protein
MAFTLQQQQQQQQQQVQIQQRKRGQEGEGREPRQAPLRTVGWRVNCTHWVGQSKTPRQHAPKQQQP